MRFLEDKIKYANAIGRLNNKRLVYKYYRNGAFEMLESEGMLIPYDIGESLKEELLVFAKERLDLETLDFAGIPKHQFDAISEMGDVVWEELCYLYTYEGDFYTDISDTLGPYTLDTLKEADATCVFEHYTYPDDGIEYIKGIIDNELTLCARYEGEAVSWVVQRQDGSLGIMYTLKQHRNKGLGLWLSRHIMNEVMRRGEKPYLHIMVNNAPSIALAKALNMTNWGETVWFGVKNPYIRS